MTPKAHKQVIPLLKEAVNSFVTHPIILFPFVTTAFIQLLVLEIIYFAPRFPLVYFFGPVIRRMAGETYLHYPQHLFLLPKWFQVAQYFLFIFVSSFLIAVAIEIIKDINSNKKTAFPGALRAMLPQYVHVCLAAILTFCVFYALSKLHGLAIVRALQIRSETGVFYLIKATVLYGAPYLNLLIGTLVTAVFAFVLPIIVIERKKVFQAIALNFKYLHGSFWFIFLAVLIPMLFYVPVMLLQGNLSSIANLTFEGIRLISPAISIIVLTLIDATVYTAITTHFLWKKETV